MGIKRNPYLRHIDSYKDDSKAFYSLTRTIGLRADQVDPIYLTTDGKIVANGFVDKNDNIEFYLDKNSKLSYKRQLDSNTSAKHSFDPKETFTKTGIAFEILEGDFNYYENATEYYDKKDSLKFNYLNKTTKKLVENNSSGPFVFHFTHENGNKYPLPHIKGSWFPAFNYDIHISPTNYLTNTNDIIVIKSGEYKTQSDGPATSLIDVLFYSSGTTGNIYIDTLSIPNHSASSYAELDDSVKNVKIPRTGNSNYGVGATKTDTPSGPVGVFKNGVLAFSYKSSNAWTGAGTYTENSYIANRFDKDSCEGFTALGPDLEGVVTPINTYHYKSAPKCIYDTDSTAHSPLLGYAFDGNPIYGPYGYTTALDSGSAPKLMTPSWRLKGLSNRTNGPDFDSYFYPSGYFQEDYEYVSGLGDLDRYNGRTCITPEYPGGVYAYFTTVDSSHEPVFPYIIGDKFYGKVEQQNYSGVTVTEPVNLITGLDELSQADFDVSLFEDSIYGLKFTKSFGLNKETIIWVSPHELKSYTGVCLTTGTYQYIGATGQSASFSGNLFTASGNSTYASSSLNNKYIAESRALSYPSSVDYAFAGKTPFSGGVAYVRTDPDTVTQQIVNGYTDLGATNFYTIYSGYKNGIESVKSGAKNPNFETGVWNGVIPSGVPFKIEVWSFNGGLCGFEDRISIHPVEDHPAVSNKQIAMNGIFTGVGDSPQQAHTDMIDKADKFFKRQISSYLMSSGVIDYNSKTKKFGRLLKKGVVS
tara:strand:- start:850 stop:3114 length:2265 start_codon:yes stop_codon:yes gene_type:complete